jgi:hypothetical protein
MKTPIKFCIFCGYEDHGAFENFQNTDLNSAPKSSAIFYCRAPRMAKNFGETEILPEEIREGFLQDDIGFR